jgi:hypothetical protein
MSQNTHWVIRNLDISEQILTAENAVALGRAHAELHKVCQSNYAAVGVAKERLIYEGRNEPQPGERDFILAYEMARLQRAIELDVWGLSIGSWGVGQPGTYYGRTDTAVDWAFLEPLHKFMRAGRDRLGLHQYWGFGGPWEKWPDGKTRWGDEGGRHLQCPWMDVEIIISEGGLDDGVNQHPKESWQHLPGLASVDQKAAAYLDMLAWADRQYLADPRIVGITPFTNDYENKEWWQFDTSEEPFWTPYEKYITAGIAFSRWGDQRTARWHPLIENQAGRNGLDPRVVATVVAIESGGKMDAARNGLIGLMQVKPLAAAGVTLAIREKVLLNPEQNLIAGCALLNKYLAKYLGDMAYALAAYHLGPAFITATGINSAEAKAYLTRFVTAWGQLWKDIPCPVKVTATPTPPPVVPPVVVPATPSIEEKIRNAAWLALYPAGGIPFNPDAAFQKLARFWVMGAPNTREIDAADYRFQGFADGILYAPIGQWDQIKSMKW